MGGGLVRVRGLAEDRSDGGGAFGLRQALLTLALPRLRRGQGGQRLHRAPVLRLPGLERLHVPQEGGALRATRADQLAAHLGDLAPQRGLFAQRRRPRQQLRGGGVRRGRLRRSRPRRLLEAFQRGGDVGPDGLRLLLAALPVLGEPRLDVAEAAGVEQAAQQLPPVLRVRLQEAGEIPLRQQHDLGELVPAHADQVQQLGADLLVRAAARPPGVVLGGPLAQQGLRLDRRQALAALLGAHLLRAALDQQPSAAEGELQLDPGEHGRVRVVAAQPAPGPAAAAGHGAVQGEADRVQDAGLAGARGARQQEETTGGERVEVDALLGAERAEGGDGQLVQAHQISPPAARAAASTASTSSVDSAAVAAAPRTWRTKPSATAPSSRPRTRAP